MGIFSKDEIKIDKIDPNNLIGSILLDRVEIPLMKESLNGKIVNYGYDNRYPQYLIDLSKTSALHREIIENKTVMTCGDLYINDMLLDDWLKSISGVNSIRLQNLFYNTKYPFRDWLKKTAYDYQLFGAYSTEVIWDSKFEYIKLFKYVDTSCVRSGLMNKDGEIEKYYFSREWVKYNTKYTPISVFDIENDKDLNQIIYKRDHKPGITYYTEPSYIAGLTYINLDSELGQFCLSHIQNGMNPGLIFKVPFTFKSGEEKEAFMREFFSHYKGAHNNNNPLILAKNGEATWDIEKIDLPEFDKQLISLNDVIYQQLIFAHKVTNGALIGLEAKGKLFPSTPEEMAFSEKKFYETCIEPARLMMEETIEDVIRTYGINVSAKIKNKI